jgi:fatty-acyl-CoA synthase
MDLYTMLDRWAAQFPDRCALSFHGRLWTFREFKLSVDRITKKLSQRGVTVGDIVAYWSKNDPTFFFVAFACAKLGASFAPLNFRLSAIEADAILAEIGAVGLVAETGLAESIRNPSTPGRWWCLTVDDANAVASQKSNDEAKDEIEPDLHRPALMLFTSGTTGRPRGVQLTHANLWHSMLNVIIGGDFRRDDVILQMAPLSAVATWPWALATWIKGGEIALLQAVSATDFLRVVPERKVTSFAPVVALLVAVAASPEFETADLSSMRWIVPGGAVMSDQLRDKWVSKGVEIRLAYGMTETTGMAAFLAPEYAASKPGAAGFPLMLTEIRVVDPAGRVLEQGQGGEVWLRGPNITEVIWIEGVRTPARDSDGWFHTGDVGRFDEDGVLFIIDRLKDMIKSGGENVYSAEVERVLLSHPGVSEVAIIGAPDEKWGETVVACVVPVSDFDLTLEEMRVFGAQYIARYKLPTRLVLFDEFQKSSSGKVQKTMLRAYVAAMGVTT